MNQLPLFLTKPAVRMLLALADSDRLERCDYDPKRGYTSERPSLTTGELTRIAFALPTQNITREIREKQAPVHRLELSRCGLVHETGWFIYTITDEGLRVAAELRASHEYVAVA